MATVVQTNVLIMPACSRLLIFAIVSVKSFPNGGRKLRLYNEFPLRRRQKRLQRQYAHEN